MKLIVKIGNVFRDGTWENETHFEEDECYETETKSIETAQHLLRQDRFNIYHIYESNNKIIACVFWHLVNPIRVGRPRTKLHLKGRKMKRSKSQLRAISYSYASKEYERLNDLLKQHGLTDEFKNSQYKTIRGFLKSKKII